MRRIFLLIGLCFFVLIAGGCSGEAIDLLTQTYTKNDISPIEIVAENDQCAQLTQFSLDLLSALPPEDNLLVSPLSIVSALSMTANGANNETLAQMEAVLGAEIENLNEYLYAYRLQLPEGDAYQVHLANSIWMSDVVTLCVRDAFLQTNVDYYDAQVFQAAFDTTLAQKVNTWVSDHTDGMIAQILEENAVPEGVLYLINALSFEAQWEDAYEETSIRASEFVGYDGSITQSEFMYSAEYAYLSLENAEGFQKYYADGAYSFVAILPEEGLDIYEFVASLDGELLQEALENTSNEQVNVSIPQFTVEYDGSLKDTLIALGMTDCFDDILADFSQMAAVESGTLYIGDVIHKTKIQVDEQGTKAGALTMVEVRTEGAAPALVEIKEVYLTRPFFYMIVDETQNFPIFMGVYTAVE